MKGLIVGGLSVLLLSAVAPAALAESMAMNATRVRDTNFSNVYQIQPFNLAWLAYQGYFKAQGIPSNESLILAYKSGTVSVMDIIKSAIATGQLPADVAMDKNYQSALARQLQSLDTH